MVFFGIGDLIGAGMSGYINNKKGGKTLAKINVGLTFLAFGIIIFQNEYNAYSFFSFCATLFFGIANSSLITQINLILGYEFDSHSEPFAVF